MNKRKNERTNESEMLNLHKKTYISVNVFGKKN